jgi:glycerol-3-phosphate acyltransferase PlsX
MVKIVVDAMGADNAPHPEIEGALMALSENPEDLKIYLVGDEDLLRKKIDHRYDREKLVFINAEEKITMEEKASEALRKKVKSSIAVGLTLLKEGKADGFVSAGNTGAVMAFSLMILGRIEGVRRPAIGAFLPTLKEQTLLLDAGANPLTKAEHLYQFAVMGSIFVKFLREKERPRVALLSIGEEATKGNPLIMETQKLLKLREDLFDFIGNIEGNHILEGKTDVVVTDGFTGNVLLKFGEGVVDAVAHLAKEEVKKNILATLAAILLKPTFYRLKKKLHYEEYGGAPLLGVDGIVIISHGRSTPKAIKNAVLMAKRLVESDLNRHIKEEIIKSLSPSNRD